jgi:fimbrial chaperone protein
VEFSVLRRILTGIACLAGATTVALAGSFDVSPVRIDIARSRPSAVVRVTNRGAEPVTIQAQTQAWSYAGEQDVLADTDDVLLNPPVFTLAPGATQFLRVGMRTRNAPPTEASYRIVLEELPAEARPDDVGVRTLLRISFPLFVAPAGAKALPQLTWRMTRDAAAGILLTATNEGNAHVKVSEISLRPDSGDAVASANLLAYLLPGQTREWRIPGPALAVAAQVELAAQSDAGEIHERLAPAH